MIFLERNCFVRSIPFAGFLYCSGINFIASFFPGFTGSAGHKIPFGALCPTMHSNQMELNILYNILYENFIELPTLQHIPQLGDQGLILKSQPGFSIIPYARRPELDRSRAVITEITADVFLSWPFACAEYLSCFHAPDLMRIMDIFLFLKYFYSVDCISLAYAQAVGASHEFLFP
jgi:hypothetical protein